MSNKNIKVLDKKKVTNLYKANSKQLSLAVMLNPWIKYEPVVDPINVEVSLFNRHFMEYNSRPEEVAKLTSPKNGAIRDLKLEVELLTGKFSLGFKDISNTLKRIEALNLNQKITERFVRNYINNLENAVRGTLGNASLVTFVGDKDISKALKNKMTKISKSINKEKNNAFSTITSSPAYVYRDGKDLIRVSTLGESKVNLNQVMKVSDFCKDTKITDKLYELNNTTNNLYQYEILNGKVYEFIGYGNRTEENANRVIENLNEVELDYQLEIEKVYKNINDVLLWEVINDLISVVSERLIFPGLVSPNTSINSIKRLSQGEHTHYRDNIWYSPNNPGSRLLASISLKDIIKEEDKSSVNKYNPILELGEVSVNYLAEKDIIPVKKVLKTKKARQFIINQASTVSNDLTQQRCESVDNQEFNEVSLIRIIHNKPIRATNLKGFIIAKYRKITDGEVKLTIEDYEVIKSSFPEYYNLSFSDSYTNGVTTVRKWLELGVPNLIPIQISSSKSKKEIEEGVIGLTTFIKSNKAAEMLDKYTEELLKSTDVIQCIKNKISRNKSLATLKQDLETDKIDHMWLYDLKHLNILPKTIIDRIKQEEPKNYKIFTMLFTLNILNLLHLKVLKYIIDNNFNWDNFKFTFKDEDTVKLFNLGSNSIEDLKSLSKIPNNLQNIFLNSDKSIFDKISKYHTRYPVLVENIANLYLTKLITEDEMFWIFQNTNMKLLSRLIVNFSHNYTSLLDTIKIANTFKDSSEQVILRMNYNSKAKNLKKHIEGTYSIFNYHGLASQLPVKGFPKEDKYIIQYILSHLDTEEDKIISILANISLVKDSLREKKRISEVISEIKQLEGFNMLKTIEHNSGESLEKLYSSVIADKNLLGKVKLLTADSTHYKYINNSSAKDITNALLGKVKQNIKPVTINLESKMEFKILSKTDPLGLLLGEKTNCCQTIGGVAESCVVEGYKNPDSGFAILSKDGNIIGQSWIYLIGDTLVLDNIEFNLKYKATVEEKFPIKNIYQEIAESLPYKEVQLGLGYMDNKWSSLKTVEEDKKVKLADYRGYSDSKDRRVYLKEEN